MIAGIVISERRAPSRTLARVETVLANAADRVNRAGEGCNYDDLRASRGPRRGLGRAARPRSRTSYYVAGRVAGDPGTWVTRVLARLVSDPRASYRRSTITVTGPSGKTHTNDCDGEERCLRESKMRLERRAARRELRRNCAPIPV